ncbi:class I SAM-dependent RNA methyltransferase [Thalassorhabdomicrobium marinisediminis]|uniref:Class I SAM-dependent RNA methyltransferase n=1 Tax=Thalassorhabdomicrobium marinisediminis TaxID=2170577 RepID=A0A2T7FZV8_9RHOB|nr:class I SAM-dependent RNA methyltransferase [Thalassorhabdomicrobium marinisediminis]PVA07678.1 class I SAM-dependent RNA methyltransferase [Thalassorhabdomicrobium marinisediminis]
MTQTIERLTLTGQGQLPDGTLLDRVLPGEEVEVQPDGSARIITPVVDRVKPPCRHFKSCGGCALQHASDGFVGEWKKTVVERALAARGLPFPFRSLHTSPPQSRRRARLSGRRTKKGAMVGFHAKASDALIEIPDCQLLMPSIMAGFPAFEALTVIAASRKSEVNLTVTDTLGGLDVLVETERELTGPLRIELAALAEVHDLARLAWNDDVVVTRKDPQQQFGTTRVAPPSGAFLQATREGEAAMVHSVLGAVTGAGRIVDLFSGAGTFTLPLAQGASVHAVEGDSELLQALDRGWRHGQHLRPVTTEVRDLFRRPLEPDELNRFDLALLDPPRAGAEAQVRAIAASDLRRVVMVSCNPVTFARDVQTLTEAGFVLDQLDVIDQFRWSPHIEVVGELSRP